MDQSQHQIGQTHMQGGSECPQVTCAPGVQHQLEVSYFQGSASMPLQQKVVSFLAHLFGGSGYLRNYWGTINLVQFWAPFRTDTGETVLIVWEQPFGPGQLCNGLLRYRTECIFDFRQPCVGRDPVSLAFQNHMPQCTKLTSGWCAEAYDFPSCWALPLVEPSLGCVGVLEFISLTDCSELYDRGSRLYELFCQLDMFARTFFTNGHFLENLGDHVPMQQYVSGNDNSYSETMNALEAANGDIDAQNGSASPTSKVAPTCNNQRRTRNKEIDDSYTVKAKYEGLIVRFKINSSTTLKGLRTMLSKRFVQLELGSFTIEYKDALTDPPVMISRNKDLKAFLMASKTMELFVISGNY